MPHLIVVYGARGTGKSSLARAVAALLPEKAAIVSTDALARDAIVVHDRDGWAELEMVHTQARLLVANYLKNRYHVVLEGRFYYEQDGAVLRFEQEIDQTLALMRNMAPAPLTVHLEASQAALRRRTGDGGTGEAAAGSPVPQYKQRYGSRALVLDSSEESVEELAQTVVESLGTG